MLTVTTVGITEASATRRPEVPITRRSGVTTESGVVPIVQLPAGWNQVLTFSQMYFAISSSDSTLGPGKYSPLDHSAKAGAAAIARLCRTASISAFRSSGSVK